MSNFVMSVVGIMDALDEVTEFEENLMNELDEDFMNTVPNPHSQYLMQHMDIREPLTKLRKLIEKRLGVNLQGYLFTLQGVQIVSNYLFEVFPQSSMSSTQKFNLFWLKLNYVCTN